MEVRCSGKNNKYSFPGRRRRERGGNTGYRGPVRKNSDKQHGRETATYKLAEMAANVTKIG